METSCDITAEAFRIEQADLQFYARVAPVYGGTSFPLLPPKISPDVRSQMRCYHRNERALYKRRCNLTGTDFISMYSPEAPFPVYSPAAFFGDNWNALFFGSEYHEDRLFFDQLAQLYAVVPRLGIINQNSQNSDYCNYSYGNKNCYLTFGSHYEEDCYYCAYSTKNRYCSDCFWAYGCELCYQSSFCKNCYRSMYLEYCEECDSCRFSRDLKGCRDCLFCANLRHKQYHIFNVEYSKTEYLQFLNHYRLNTAAGLAQAVQTHTRELPNHFPVRAVYQTQCENCEGSTLSNCRNMRQAFFCADSEDCAYARQVDCAFDSQDLDFIGYDRSELCCQAIGCLGLYHSICCNACWNGSELAYCQYCFGCSNCLGCISLQKQSYCIFNRQYTKDDYEKLAAQIARLMIARGEWGAFFPPSLSPFSYEESMAAQLYSFGDDEVAARGFVSRPPRESRFAGRPPLSPDELPEAIEDTTDEVLERPIRCRETGRPFKLIPQELELYRKLSLPIPRVCPQERQLQRMQRRHPCRLWKRNCAATGQEILTVIDPMRPEAVLSEEAYLNAVY